MQSNHHHEDVSLALWTMFIFCFFPSRVRPRGQSVDPSIARSSKQTKTSFLKCPLKCPFPEWIIAEGGRTEGFYDIFRRFVKNKKFVNVIVTISKTSHCTGDRSWKGAGKCHISPACKYCIIWKFGWTDRKFVIDWLIHGLIDDGLM